jgi:hypothetical protein
VAPAFRARVNSARRVIEALDFEIEVFTNLVGSRLRGHDGYTAIQTISGVGRSWVRCSSPRSVMCIASAGQRSWPAGPG